MPEITEYTGISLAQIEYFKSSKMRNPDGTLQIYHHGTEHDFDRFSVDHIKSEPGFWFCDHRGYSIHYGDRILSVYLNITNPFVYLGFRDATLIRLYNSCFKGEALSYYNIFSFRFRDYLIKQGYDGILQPLYGNCIAIAFYPSQIKAIDNHYPKATPLICD